MDEISAGDKEEIRKRLGIVEDLKIPDLTEKVEDLTEAIIDSGAIPPKAVRDAGHIAVATIHRMNYLLTWNCKHIANSHILKRIQKICATFGFEIPVICTPVTLIEVDND